MASHEGVFPLPGKDICVILHQIATVLWFPVLMDRGSGVIVAVAFLLSLLAFYKPFVWRIERRYEERTLAKEREQRREERLQPVQSVDRLGSLKHDLSTGAYMASPEYLRIFGWTPEQHMPNDEMFRERIHPEDYPTFQEVRSKAMREKTGYALEYRLSLPGGSIRRVCTVAQPVFDGSGNLMEYIGTTLDITERRQAECAVCHAQADLEHTDRVTTMGELTASLAHEIIQPIAAAVTDANTCVRWLSRDKPDLGEARAAAERMVKDTARATAIISRIRLMFKKDNPHRTLLEVNDVIREMIHLLRNETVQNAISIQTELEPDLPPIMADRVQLQQVLMNLMVNGIDAMKEVEGTRELIIQSRRADEAQLQISVRDTGVGLPSQQGDHIFDAFFTTKPHGTGLGLRISRSIVESHGGRLWADDHPPQGVVFHFTLPLHHEATQ